MNESNYLEELVSMFHSVIALKTHEGDLVWSRFNSFVVTHTIFFIIIGQILVVHPKLSYQNNAIVTISFVGILLSVFWLISTIRGFESVEF